MGLELPEHAPERLIDYIGLLMHWNKAFNLTAIRDPREMISKHLLDSLSVQPFIGGGLVADVGSGAGLPGIPLAIALPQTQFVLIDTNGKKTRFLTQAKISLGLDNIEVVHSRVEEYRPDNRFDVIISRAYAGTNDILSSTEHLQGQDTRILVMQGKLDEGFDHDNYRLLESTWLDVYGLDAERHAHLPTCNIRTLFVRPERRFARRVPKSQSCMRLYKSVFDSLGAEFILPDMIRFLKSFLEVAKFYVCFRTYVIRLIVMNEGGSFLHRFEGIKNSGKYLILNPNEFQGFFVVSPNGVGGQPPDRMREVVLFPKPGGSQLTRQQDGVNARRQTAAHTGQTSLHAQ